MDKSQYYPLLTELNNEIILCKRCLRLVEFRERIASEKRKQFQDWEYWGKPVPGYGVADARLLIVGLAPAAHGGNRTGRVFTGDKSGAFLMKCLYTAGLSNQSKSDTFDDGLNLYDSYITPVLKCAPPQDKPTADELKNCYTYFERELLLFDKLKVILALGQIAFNITVKYIIQQTELLAKDYQFGHDVWYLLPNGIWLVGAYHPSPRNVNTKRLTSEMMVELLNSIKGRL